MDFFKRMAILILLAPLASIAANHTSLKNQLTAPHNPDNGQYNIGGEFAIECPSDIILSCIADIPDPDWTALDFMNSCDPESIEFSHYDEWEYQYECGGLLLRVYEAYDACENFASCTQYIDFYEDFTIYNCPPDLNLNCASEIPSIDSSEVYTLNGCGTDTVPVDVFDFWISGPTACQGQFYRYYYGGGYCEDSDAFCEQIITYETTIPPLFIDPPESYFTECSDAIKPPQEVVVLANCNDGEITIALEEEYNFETECPVASETTYTWTATDGCDNASTHTQTISHLFDTNIFIDLVTDNFEHIEADTVFVSCDENFTAPSAYTYTFCSEIAVELVSSVIPSDCGYTENLSYSATDECNNTTVRILSVVYVDLIPPVILGLPEDYTTTCNDAVPPPAEVVAIDNCTASPQIDVDDVLVEGECPYSVIIERTYTATDDCGNSSSHTQLIYFEDNYAPVFINTPQDETLSCIGNLPDPDPTLLEAEGQCGNEITIAFLSDFLEGNDCNGTITRTYLATDNCDNVAYFQQYFQIQNSDTPIIEMGNLSDGFLTVNCDTQLEISIPFAYDACGGAIPVFTSGTYTPGACENDWYEHFVYTATDACSNTAIDSVTIHFVDDTVPFISPVADYNLDGCNASWPELSTNWTDNCSDGGIVNGVAGDITTNGCVQFRDYTFSVSDECSNFASVTTTVSRTFDNVAPTFDNAPENMIVDCNNIPDVVEVSVTDNCDVDVLVEYDEETVEGECVNNYTLIRTWTATDDCGNTTVFEQVIIVEDNTAPVFSSCPEDAFYNSLEDVPAPDSSLLEAEDNCTTDIAYAHTEDEIYGDDCSGTIHRHYSATDECGNTAICTQTITYITDINTTVLDSGSTLFATESDATYQWIDCENDSTPISGANGAEFIANENGSYAVIISSNGCSEISDCFDIVSVGIQTAIDELLFSIYPNPNDGRFVIEMISEAEISVYDISGRLAYKKQLIKGRNAIDLTEFSNGVYLVTGRNDKQVFTERIIINQ